MIWSHDSLHNAREQNNWRKDNVKQINKTETDKIQSTETLVQITSNIFNRFEENSVLHLKVGLTGDWSWSFFEEIPECSHKRALTNPKLS